MKNHFLVSLLFCIVVFVSTKANASTLQLNGLLGTGVTAAVSNVSLVGSVFSFDLTNTSPTAVITNLGLSLGDVVDMTGFTTTSPFSWIVVHDGTAPPEPLLAALLPANDFFVTKGSGNPGILPGATFTFAFTLTLDVGAPLSGLTADALTDGITVRFHGIPGPTEADIAATVVPEPNSLVLVTSGILAAAQRIRRRR